MTAFALRSALDRRFPWVLGLGFLGLGLLVGLHVAVGTVELSPAQVWAALLGRPAEALHQQIVWSLRLPRALVALLAGAMLGTAGALLQIVTRNPLAEPGLTGVAGGAVLAIIVAILWGGSETAALLPLWGVAGGLAAGCLAYLLSLRGGTDPAALILMGVLVAGLCAALTTALLLGARETEMMRILRWTVGSTNGRVWTHLHTLLPYAALGLPLAFLSAGLANALSLGDGIARALGQRVEGARLWLLLVAAVLTAGAVAVVGAVGLIGLIGPHVARSLAGEDARRLLPLSAVITGALLLGADILARTLELSWAGTVTGLNLPEGAGLPVGAVTALLGVPFFLVLLLRAGDRT